MGGDSSSRTKELFNLPSLVVKARHLGGSAFCNFYGLRVPKQALGGIPLGFGIVVWKINLLNFHVSLSL